MREHGEALEVDLLRMGIDLPRDLGTERLSFRRLELLLRHLPADSVTARRLHGPPPAWGAVEHLLASVIDVLQVQGWATRGAVLGAGGVRQNEDRPKPIRRPDDPKPERRVVGVRDLAKMMSKGKRRRRSTPPNPGRNDG